VGATRLNHVSVHADDLEESSRFYEEVFGAERVPTPNFGFPVVWLQIGEQQLHLFQREPVDAPRYHHLAFDVDDFEAVFLKARERDCLREEDGVHVREHPAGWAQMYLEDPAGNLIEVDSPDAASLDRSVVPVARLAEIHEQAGEAATATLYRSARV
jgi:catechol 2,3-dioxygenase-like lactoylglutathione lyase family enzyme